MFRSLRKKTSLLLISLDANSLAPAPTGSSATSAASSISLAAPSASYSVHSKVVKQVHDFEIALKAMDYLLDDRTEQGVQLLKDEIKKHAASKSDQPAAIFTLALGVMEFIEATLGFEPDVMDKAHRTLDEAESQSWANNKYNIKHKLQTSRIYPPGTEFQVTLAELTLLNALVMLLRENNGMMEQAKALFKLRKAYHALDAIYRKMKEQESKFNSLAVPTPTFESLPASRSTSSVDLPGYVLDASLSSASLPMDLKLINDLEKVYQMRKLRIYGTSINSPKDIIQDTKSNEANEKTNSNTSNVEESDSDNEQFSDAYEDFSSESIDAPLTASALAPALAALDPRVNVGTIDEFIHSGVQLCFGILQVVLSLIPPTIGKVLSIVGFKGERDVGLKLLWKNAITTRNIHGDLALLCILVFYDGPVQFVDRGFQIPSRLRSFESHTLDRVDNLTSLSDLELDEILHDPHKYIPQVLTRTRAIFPHNALWILQYGRMLASKGEVTEAVKMMQDFTDNPDNKIQMQQAEALMLFDRAMFYAFKHQYDLAARDLIRLVAINSWSKAVYLFMAGSCYNEMYRMIKLDLVAVDDKASSMEKYSQLAKKYMNELAPSYVPGVGANSKKGGIGGGNKKMPFDNFLLRKLKSIEEVSKANPSLQFVECIGASPIHELVYFWNGYNRKSEEELELSLKLLDFPIPKQKNLNDELMINEFLRSVVLRSLGKVKEGLAVLDQEVLSKYVTSISPFKHTKMTYSPYLYPTALYEKTMFIWMLRILKSDAKVHTLASEAREWLKRAEIVGDIGDYELSNRTGMRIKAASDRLDQFIKLPY